MHHVTTEKDTTRYRYYFIVIEKERAVAFYFSESYHAQQRAISLLSADTKRFYFIT